MESRIWILAVITWAIFAAGVHDLYAADFYVTGQAGYAKVNGPGTESNIEEDCNLGWPWQILDKGSSPRIAIGTRSGAWGLEAGLGSLPRYTRRIDLSVGPDVANENVKTQAVDLRGLYYFRQRGRITPYVFGSLAFVRYERHVWTGHEEVNGAAVPTQSLISCQDGKDSAAQYQCAVDAWDHSTGITIGYGAGVGAEYRITKNWSATAEASALLGEFHVYSGRLGIRYNF
jgi:opacity protein-like surface antigen